MFDVYKRSKCEEVCQKHIFLTLLLKRDLPLMKMQREGKEFIRSSSTFIQISHLHIQSDQIVKKCNFKVAKSTSLIHISFELIGGLY